MVQATSSELIGNLFEHLPCGVVICSAAGRVLWANRQAQEVLGLDVSSPVLRNLDLAEWQATDREGRALPSKERPALAVFSKGPIKDFEMSLTRPDGRQVWLLVDSISFEDDVEGPLSVTTFVDATKRHQAEEALREQAVKAEEMLTVVNLRHRQQQAIAELGRLALEGSDAQDLMDRACELVASTLRADRVRVMEVIPAKRELLLRAGHGWKSGLVGSAVIPMDGSQAGYLLDSNQPLIIEDFRADHRFHVSWLLREHQVMSGVRAVIRGPKHPFGEIAAYTRKRRTFTDDDIFFMRAIANTLAEALIRIAADQQLDSSLQQLRETNAARRELLRRLARVVEEERSRIARDVHDDALQALAALGIRLELLAETLDRPDQQETVGQIVGSLQHSTDRLRQLILDLRPDALEFGLEAAIRFYFEQTRSELDPELVVQSSVREEPPSEQRLAIYRACQEALNNVRKHAQATRVVVTLEDRASGLQVTVADDGNGFSVAKAPPTGHMGLTAMRERAELIGGSFSITSRRGRGTRVRFWFPLHGADPSSSHWPT